MDRILLYLIIGISVVIGAGFVLEFVFFMESSKKGGKKKIQYLHL